MSSRATPFVVVPILLGLFLQSTVAAASGFDWSGRSDVYLEQLYGDAFTGPSLADGRQPFQSTDLGWSYRFGDSGVFLNGFVRANETSELEVSANAAAARMDVGGTGYGLGLGWGNSVWRIEGGVLTENLTLTAVNGSSYLPTPSQPEGSTPYAMSGNYVHLGINLFRWSHLLIQADAQVEALRHEDFSDADKYLPKSQYAASAGMSIHATDINTVIPAAVAITALAIAACIKGCKGSSPNMFYVGNGNSQNVDVEPAHDDDQECKPSKDKDCKR